MIVNVAALVLVIVFLAGLILFSARVRSEGTIKLRALPGFQNAQQAIARSAEYGRPIHLSTGPGGVGDNSASTAETLAGLNMTGALAQECAATGTPVLVTTGDGMAYNLADNVVRGGFANVGRLSDAPSGMAGGRTQGVRMLTHNDPLAFAAASTDIIDNEQILHTTSIGGWGPEYLLLGESQQRKNVESVAGATSPQALAVMAISAKHTLVGEEIYAAGAYIQPRPEHIASLLTQDLVRWIIIALIIIGALLATVLGSSIISLTGVS